MILTIVIFFISFIFAYSPALAIYDPLSVPNNKFGIHILETNELNKAKDLVNSSGGDWGYVTIPIRADDRNLPKWQTFMDECKKLHLIPIIRLATFAKGDHWVGPNEYHLIDFANFLNELAWPTMNRYILVYNEPNHEHEWGGFVYPEEYARVLDRAVDIFHKRHPDFFVIMAGFDSAAPNGPSSMNEYDYLQTMHKTIPDIFYKIDGWSSHSYGNPGFNSPPNPYSKMSVGNFHFEREFLIKRGLKNDKLFITEAGWNQLETSSERTDKFFQEAFSQYWIDSKIIAITPFLLSANAGPFEGFSFTKPNGEFFLFAKNILSMSKEKGQPIQAPIQAYELPIPSNEPTSHSSFSTRLLSVWGKLKEIMGI